MVFEGPAAAGVGDFARRQWRRATGLEVRPHASDGATAWPESVRAEFAGVPVGIARTDPWHEARPVREIETLTHDALMRAERAVYIEAQYLTSRTVSDALLARLARPDAPEIVILLCAAFNGYLEGLVMGPNRDRLIRRLKAADRMDRLRVYYLVSTKGPRRSVLKMHAKLMIVDDRVLRIGSSNLNNRSMGVDLECDVAVEAHDDVSRRQILAIRDRLLASHLKTSAEAVSDALRTTGSLIGAIDRLDGGKHLRRFAAETEPGPVEPIVGTALLDPAQPITLQRVFRWLPRLGAHRARA